MKDQNKCLKTLKEMLATLGRRKEEINLRMIALSNYQTGAYQTCGSLENEDFLNETEFIKCEF